MAYVNTAVRSQRPQVPQPQPQAPKGWLGRAVGAIKEALSGPAVRTQSVTNGPDTFHSKTQVHVNRPRQLDALNGGYGADKSRGLRSINVPDNLLLNELDRMSNGDYDRFI